MNLNRVDDRLRIPIGFLKKANRLMRYGKANRLQIARVLASKMARHGEYRRLEETDVLLAVSWRLEVADPEHPSHEDWQGLLQYWRGRRHREKQRKRRKEDPEYDKLFREKKKAYRQRKKSEDPNYQIKQREYVRRSEAKMREENPQRWQEVKERKSETAQIRYYNNREFYIEKAKTHMAALKQDPVRYDAYRNRMRTYQRDYYQQNKERLTAQRRERRRIQRENNRDSA